MAVPPNPYVYLETMEETKNQSIEFDESWGTERTSMDSSKN